MQIRVVLAGALIVGLLLGNMDQANSKTAPTPQKSLQADLANVQNPPAWVRTTKVDYDTSLSWKDARLEIRRLLSFNEPEKNRQAITLNWIYLQKEPKSAGEWPMYLYLAGEYAWSVAEYRKFLNDLPAQSPYTHAFRCLASLYISYEEYQLAREILEKARSRLKLTDPKWIATNTASVHDGLGDLYVAMGKKDLAKKEYQQAVKLYPTSQQPWGRHLLKRQAAKVQSKIDMLDLQQLKTAKLKDGSYETVALGYSEDIKLQVTIGQGRIADIKILEHKEKIEQGALKTIPQRIIRQQRLDVDGITGATVTCDAIKDGVFQALKKAGL